MQNFQCKGTSFGIISAILMTLCTFMFAPRTLAKSPQGIQGFVSPNASFVNNIFRLRGWVCDYGVERSISAHVYVADPSGRNRQYLKAVRANHNNEVAVNRRCGTQHSRHRFVLDLTPEEVRAHQGRVLFVHGLSEKHRNLAIQGSGKIQIPAFQVPLVHRELIRDPEFLYGFNIRHPDGKMGAEIKVPPRFSSPEEHRTPAIWSISQWGSLATLPRGSRVNGSWVNWQRGGYKRVGLDTATGTLEFAINSINEYGGVFRQPHDSRKWPHLLIQQRISHPQDRSQQTASLSEMKQLVLNVETQLRYARHEKGPGYNPRIHAAQFVLFFTLQNLNRNSAGFGEYVWFGIPLYDSRYNFPKRVMHIDKGTRRLIYGLEGNRYMPHSPQSGKKINISYDILPDARAALNYAFSENLLHSKDLSDYRIGGMNTGFEVPGLSVVTFRIRGLSLVEVTPAN